VVHKEVAATDIEITEVIILELLEAEQEDTRLVSEEAVEAPEEVKNSLQDSEAEAEVEEVDSKDIKDIKDIKVIKVIKITKVPQK